MPAAILAGQFGFDPLLYAPSLEGELSANGELWAAVRCVPINIPSPDIRLSVTLTPVEGAGETPVPIEVVDRKKSGDADVFE